jgi:hypothetical protein
MTKVDMDGKHVGNQNEWGFCEEGCEETNVKGCEDNSKGCEETNVKGCKDNLKGCDETNVKGCNSLQPPKNCVFPFSFRGSTFNSCTNEGGDVSSELWCSTKTDEFGNHVRGNWEICPEGCSLETELITTGTTADTKTATTTTTTTTATITTTPVTFSTTQSTTTVIVTTPFDETSSKNNLLGTVKNDFMITVRYKCNHLKYSRCCLLLSLFCN